jgi:hypothetical protein
MKCTVRECEVKVVLVGSVAWKGHNMLRNGDREAVTRCKAYPYVVHELRSLTLQIVEDKNTKIHERTDTYKR